MKCVPEKDCKAFATDLKTSYHAVDENKALAALEHVIEKWMLKYPNSMKRWKDDRDVISPIFKFLSEVRKIVYTKNAIESLNATYRKLNCKEAYSQVIQHCPTRRLLIALSSK